MGQYTYLDHTADIALEISGTDYPDLFRTGISAWRRVTAGHGDSAPSEQRRVELDAGSYEELLVGFISEANYLLTVKSFLTLAVKEIEFRQMPDGLQLFAQLAGRRLSANEAEIEVEVKAVTFHQMDIRKTADGLKTRLVFDI